MQGPEIAVEIMKATRRAWRSRPELVDDTSVSPQALDRWVTEMTAQGLLIERKREKTEGRGYAPAEFALAPTWGGQAEGVA